MIEVCINDDDPREVSPDELAEALIELTKGLNEREKKRFNRINTLLFNVDRRLKNGCYTGRFLWNGWDCLFDQKFGVVQLHKKRGRFYSHTRIRRSEDRAADIKAILDFLSRSFDPTANIADRTLGAGEVPFAYRGIDNVD